MQQKNPGAALSAIRQLTAPVAPSYPSGSRRQSLRAPEAASTSSITNPVLRRSDPTVWPNVSHQIRVFPVDDTGIDLSHLKQMEGGAPDVIDFQSLRVTCL